MLLHISIICLHIGIWHEVLLYHIRIVILICVLDLIELLVSYCAREQLLPAPAEASGRHRVAAEPARRR